MMVNMKKVFLIIAIALFSLNTFAQQKINVDDLIGYWKPNEESSQLFFWKDTKGELQVQEICGSSGEPIDLEYAQKRQRWEPLYEIMQIKGVGETHPQLSPNDEFADYGLIGWDNGNLTLDILIFNSNYYSLNIILHIFYNFIWNGSYFIWHFHIFF